LANTAADLLRDELERAVHGWLEAMPQEHEKSTHAPPLQRADGALNFSKNARDLVNLVRGLAPRPGAHTLLNGKPLKIAQARLSDSPRAGEPGSVSVDQKRVLISTIDGAFELVRAQLEGRKELPALDLINGRALKPGDVLGR